MPTARSAPARRELLIDCALAAAYVALVALWSLEIPFNAAPDEISHMFLVEYLVRFGEIPEPQVEPVVPFIGPLSGFELQNTINWYHGLPFAHTLGAAFLAKILSPLLPPGSGYLAARAFNWLLGGTFMFVVLRSLAWSGVRSSIATLIALLIATIPQLTFVFAYFNHDAFGVASAALGLHAFLRIVKRPDFVVADSIYLGAACGLILLAKPYHYPALLFFLLMLVLMRWITPAFRLAAALIPAIATAALVSAPMLVWTYLRYGEITGVSMIEHFLVRYPPPPVPCFWFCPDTLVHWQVIGPWTWRNLQSFFGVFGWMNLNLPDALYGFWFLPLAVMFGILATIFIVRRVMAYATSGVRLALFDASFVALTICMLIGTLALSIFASQRLAPQPQGRYLFAALPFVAYCVALFALEAQSILANAGRGHGGARPERGSRIVVGVLATLATLMLLSNLYAAKFVLAPAYQSVSGRGPFDPFANAVTLDFDALARALSVSPTDLTVTIPRKADSVQGMVDLILLRPGGRVTINGWAFDRAKDRPAEAVMIVHKGVPIHVVKVGTPRPDAVKTTGRPGALHSGFTTVFPRGDLDACSTQVFAVTSSLEATELPRGKRVCPQ
jgi:hypothetical protein